MSLNTQFTCAVFFPTAVQILATGTNRKISYWEVYDGSLVREVEASPKACVNCISINKSGEIFVTAGADQIVKVSKRSFFQLNMFQSADKVLCAMQI